MQPVTLTHRSLFYGTSLLPFRQRHHQRQQQPYLLSTCALSMQLSVTSLRPSGKWLTLLVGTLVVHCLNQLVSACVHSSSVCHVAGRRPRVRMPITTVMDRMAVTAVQMVAPTGWTCVVVQLLLRIATDQVKQDPLLAHDHLPAQHHLATRGRTRDKQAHRRAHHRAWSPRQWITQTKPRSAF